MLQMVPHSFPHRPPPPRIVFFSEQLGITHIWKILISELLFSNAMFSHCPLLKFLLVPDKMERQNMYTKLVGATF